MDDPSTPLRRRSPDPWTDPEEWCVQRFGREGFNLIRGRLAEAEAMRQAQRDGRDLRRVLAGRGAGQPSLRRLAGLAGKVEAEVARLRLGSDEHRIFRGKEESLGRGLRRVLSEAAQVRREVEGKVSRLCGRIERVHKAAGRFLARRPNGMRPGPLDLVASVLVAAEGAPLANVRANAASDLSRRPERFTQSEAALLSAACGFEGALPAAGWRREAERERRGAAWKKRLERARPS